MDDTERAKLEMERLADLVRRGAPLPPDQSPAVLRISSLRLAWDWLLCAVLIPAAIGLMVFGFSESIYAVLVALALTGALYSVRTTKDVWSKWHERNSHFLLVTRLGFYRAEGGSGGEVVLWPDVDRILRWQKREAELVLVKLKQGKEIEFGSENLLYAGGISRLFRTFGQLGQLDHSDG